MRQNTSATFNGFGKNKRNNSTFVSFSVVLTLMIRDAAKQQNAVTNSFHSSVVPVDIRLVAR